MTIDSFGRNMEAEYQSRRTATTDLPCNGQQKQLLLGWGKGATGRGGGRGEGGDLNVN